MSRSWCVVNINMSVSILGESSKEFQWKGKQSSGTWKTKYAEGILQWSVMDLAVSYTEFPNTDSCIW